MKHPLWRLKSWWWGVEARVIIQMLRKHFGISLGRKLTVYWDSEGGWMVSTCGCENDVDNEVAHD